jgi:cold shock CspA family protein
MNSAKVTRIGIFYDGNYLFHVSNYYQYHHERRARISVAGLHQFIRHKLAQLEGTDPKFCQIVDAHYFRGRLRAADAEDMDLLFKERVFDDVLVREGVTTHYLPLSREGEKGIDVWLALEAFDMARSDRFDVMALVACDGDFQPLLRKLNSTGTRIMLLGWDFKYVDRNGNDRETRTAEVLIKEATHPVHMAPLIGSNPADARTGGPEAEMINKLFVPPKQREEERVAPPTLAATIPEGTMGKAAKGTIQALKNGYGFINEIAEGIGAMFFFHGDVVGSDFLDLRVGDKVEFTIGQNDRGPCAKNVKVVKG